MATVCNVLAAPPSNDNFTSAAPFAADLPVMDESSTVEATEEAGEPLPLDTLKTVWWRWTAAESGWVLAKTEHRGNTLVDTSLAVFSGAALGSLTIVNANDDAGFTNASSLRFFANAGVTYSLQVGGVDGSTGAFAIILEASAAPPRITSIAFDPPIADVSNTAASVQVEIGIAHAAGFSFGSLNAWTPQGQLAGSASLSSFALIRGEPTDGVFRGTLFIQQFRPPGEYQLITHLTGADSIQFSYGDPFPYPDGVKNTVTVVNTGTFDIDAPELVSLTLEPTTIDVSAAEQSVQVIVRVTDSISGIGEFASRVDFRLPDFSRLGIAHLVRQNRLEGDAFDATYQAEFSVPGGFPAGTYSIFLNLSDGLGNTASFGIAGGESPFPEGLPHIVSVLNNGPGDSSPPMLKSLALDKSVINVAEREFLGIEIGITDDLSGVSGVSFVRELVGLVPAGGGALVKTPDLAGSFDHKSGSSVDGVYDNVVLFPDSTPAGEYVIAGLLLEDSLGNRVLHGPADGMTPYPAGIEPRITIESNRQPGPFDIWIAKFPTLTGASALRSADPDYDGLTNLAELAFGLNPTLNSGPHGSDPAKERAPRVDFAANQIFLAYSLATENLGSGPDLIRVQAQQSSDLVLWSGAIVTIGDPATAQIDITSGETQYLRLIIIDPRE